MNPVHDGRRLSRTGLLGLMVASTLGAGVALHPELLRSEPGAGATVSPAPTRVRLVFSEPLALPSTSVRLFDGSGQAIALTPPTAEPDSANVLVVQIRQPLEPGGYVVFWRTIGSDGHAVSDSVPFRVGASVPVGHRSVEDPARVRR